MTGSVCRLHCACVADGGRHVTWPLTFVGMWRWSTSSSGILLTTKMYGSKLSFHWKNCICRMKYYNGRYWWSSIYPYNIFSSEYLYFKKNLFTAQDSTINFPYGLPIATPASPNLCARCAEQERLSLGVLVNFSPCIFGVPLVLLMMKIT